MISPLGPIRTSEIFATKKPQFSWLEASLFQNDNGSSKYNDILKQAIGGFTLWLVPHRPSTSITSKIQFLLVCLYSMFQFSELLQIPPTHNILESLVPGVHKSMESVRDPGGLKKPRLAPSLYQTIQVNKY